MKSIVYIDILGFENLPKEISNKTGLEEDYVRAIFFTDKLKSTIDEIKKISLFAENSISEIEGSDSYLMVFDNFESLIIAINKLIDMKIPHIDYDKIQVEIGIDLIELNNDDDIKLINKTKVIDFLKSNIIELYKNMYKKEYGNSKKESFIICSKEFYKILNYFFKNKCKEYNYKDSIFYEINKNYINKKNMMYNFLDKIGIPKNSFYGYIDELYVPPIEYEDIKSSLKKQKIVFITGTPEYGKTYTAIKLLWEYFQENIEPKWEKGAEYIERNKVRFNLEYIKSILKNNRINYLEDPFGKVKYEKRESLEREIENSLTETQTYENSFLIITSREEVFKEFQNEVLNSKELNKFEKKLNIKRPSYNYKKRIEMLYLWANYYECKWLYNNKIKHNIELLMNDDKNLSTPLSIKSFAIASKNEIKRDVIEEILLKKSEETNIIFAKEIIEMDAQKQLFLMFPFIGDFRYNEVNNMFLKITEKMNIDIKYDFDFLYNWFIDDKINVRYKTIYYSHPSYYESYIYILKNYNSSITCNILFNLLDILIQYKKYINYVMEFLYEYYEYIRDDIKEKILLQSIKNNKSIDILSEIIFLFYHDIKKDILNEALLKISKNKNSLNTVREILEKYNENIDTKIQENMIFNISKLKSGFMTYFIMNKIKMHGYSEKYRIKIQTNLIKNRYNAIILINYYIEDIDTFDKNIRKNIFIKLIKKEYPEINEIISKTIRDQFNKLEIVEIMSYMDELVNKPDISHIVGWILINNFNKFKQVKIEEYLQKMSNHKHNMKTISRILYMKYNLINPVIRDNLIIKISKEEDALMYIIKIFIDYNASLDDNLKKSIIENLKTYEGNNKILIRTYIPYI